MGRPRTLRGAHLALVSAAIRGDVVDGKTVTSAFWWDRYAKPHTSEEWKTPFGEAKDVFTCPHCGAKIACRAMGSPIRLGQQWGRDIAKHLDSHGVPLKDLDPTGRKLAGAAS